MRVHINNLLLCSKIQPQCKNEVNKRQRQHSRLVPQCINIHNRKVHILTQPSIIVIRLQNKNKYVTV